ncbi:hypothetical protein PCASD_03560 [Puccinia coronata f. sp. avenae]|uniref:Uncharacterized protein n=1 Tax=Puccinia coronata f. sp. avenae TaxID=200324 RepID=A0A2N5VDL8_9BASI|nr:hypothetical protein PCASD_12537 [Puccinia coronata f. sp. avenae]PLW48092.1 hypothetical protein PCASD_03560 [Puccinia coronata f. sp. avenae]
MELSCSTSQAEADDVNIVLVIQGSTNRPQDPSTYIPVDESSKSLIIECESKMHQCVSDSVYIDLARDNFGSESRMGVINNVLTLF